VRLACLWVPYFPAAAVLRQEPECRRRPVAVMDGAAPARTTVAVTDEAQAVGVQPGMPEAEAVARCPGLIIRAISGERERAAQEALLAVALATSPRVEDGAPGVVYVDLEGLATLFGDEPAIGERLARHCRGIGLPACVGVAGSRAAALLAAKLGRQVTIIPDGQAASRLAPAPLALLELVPELHAVLVRWGVRTLGDLAELPRAGLAARLGSVGLAAQDQARGIDPRPFRPYTPPAFFQEAQGLEWEIGRLDGLMGVLEPLLARLAARLEAVHVAVDQLTLSLGLDGGGHHERLVDLACPMTEIAPMRALLQLDLEAHPPGAPVVHVALSARPVHVRAGQGGFWRVKEPWARELSVVLARLAGLVGSGRLGSPALTDSHRPDAFVLDPFTLASASASGVQRERSGAGAGRPTRAGRGIGALVLDAAPAGSAVPAPGRPRMISLRRLRPPRPADVAARGKRPVAVSARPVAGRVIACAGPWRTSGQWWREEAWARDEWDVALSDGTLCRLVRDRLANTWSLDGIYD
jgi:protein ImuB